MLFYRIEPPSPFSSFSTSWSPISSSKPIRWSRKWVDLFRVVVVVVDAVVVRATDSGVAVVATRRSKRKQKRVNVYSINI